MGKLAALAGSHHRKRGAALQRVIDEIMSVAVVALDGEEGLARPDAAAVDGNAAHALRQRALASRAHGGSHRFDGP